MPIEGLRLGGTDDQGRAIETVAAGPFDVRVAAQGLTQDSIEDLQLASFLITAISRGVLAGPVSVRRPSQDPPDRILTVAGVDHPIELTSLTVPITRSRLAEARRIARALDERLSETEVDLPHLADTMVFIADMASDSDRLPRVRDISGLVEEMIGALTPEIGKVGDTPFPTNEDGMFVVGQVIPASIAQRGRVQVRDYWLEIHQVASTGMRPFATANVQTDLIVEDVQNAFRELILRKDRPGNRTLIISSGLPDETGNASSLEVHLFGLLQRHGIGSTALSVEHIDLIVLHQWQTHDLQVVFYRQGSIGPLRPEAFGH